MAEQAIHEMIAAFSCGCMDKENFIQFKDYIRSGGQLPENELSELQNIIAMVPAILDLEKPDPVLKEKVAKKLISLQEEIKAKIKEERKKTLTQIGEMPNFASSKSFATKIHYTEDNAPQDRVTVFKGEPTYRPEEPASLPEPTPEPDEHRATNSKSKTIGRRTMPQIGDSPPSLFSPQHNTMESKRKEIDKPTSSSVVSWLAILLSLVLFIIIGYFSFSWTNDLNTKVDLMSEEIKSLRSELRNKDEFTRENTPILDFLKLKDLMIIDVPNVNPSFGGYVKLYLTSAQQKGMLELNDLPAIKGDENYQLWWQNKGKYVSAALFAPQTGSKYIPLNTLPDFSFSNIEYVVITKEPAAGSELPTGETVFRSGNLLLSKTPRK
ncbi:MAG: anti-sigma factor [Melioribacteraceae bacterium]|nr:anti-sigma factor [Melioribacteraceae bacterium]